MFSQNFCAAKKLPYRQALILLSVSFIVYRFVPDLFTDCSRFKCLYLTDHTNEKDFMWSEANSPPTLAYQFLLREFYVSSVMF